MIWLLACLVAFDILLGLLCFVLFSVFVFACWLLLLVLKWALLVLDLLGIVLAVWALGLLCYSFAYLCCLYVAFLLTWLFS